MTNVTKSVSADGTITVKNGFVTAAANFNIQRKDYNVIGESFVQKKIAEEIEISVNCQCILITINAHNDS